MSSILLPISPSSAIGAVSVSGNVIYTTSGQNFVQIASGYNQVTISGGLANMSGLGVSVNSGVAVSVSGDAVTTSVSGNYTNIASGSIAGFSGIAVSTSGNVSSISGQGMLEVGSSVIISTLSGAGMATNNSGGSLLFSGGPLISVTLRSRSGNTNMWIGGAVGTTVPYSGAGIELFANESLTFKVKNFNMVSLFATTSGQVVTYAGLGQN